LFTKSALTPANLLDGAQVARALYRTTASSEGWMWLHRAHALVEQATGSLSGRPTRLHAEAYFIRAKVEVEVGDGPHAHESLIAPEVYLLLGLTYARRGETLLAWSSYQEARRLAELESDQDIKLMAIHNLAWMALQDHNAEAADELLSLTDLLATTQYYRWHQRLRVAYVDFARGDLETAARLLSRLYSETRAEPLSRASAEVLAWTCWLSGRIALSLGLLDEAEGMCKDGQAWSIHGGDSRVMTDLSNLRAMILERQAMASD
jgi:tetratricopeptide (TPR) repeat protein